MFLFAILLQIYTKFFVIASQLHYIYNMGIIRKTKSLKTILEVFEQSSNALSVVELVKRFKNEMNKTTVYRILERLEEDGVVHSFTGTNGLKWFAKCPEVISTNQADLHPHFQCQKCGKSECLTIDISIPKLPNYRVDSANLILTGECDACLS